MCVCGGAVGSAAGFCKWPDVAASLLVWAKYVIPATYPFFVLWGITSSWCLIKIKNASLWQRHESSEEDALLNKEVYRFKISDANYLEEASEEEAVVTCIINPDEDTQHQLEQSRQLSFHNLESCLDPDEIGRVECSNDHVFLLLKFPGIKSDKQTFFFNVSTQVSLSNIFRSFLSGCLCLQQTF